MQSSTDRHLRALETEIAQARAEKEAALAELEQLKARLRE
jgi:hypothetical protein